MSVLIASRVFVNLWQLEQFGNCSAVRGIRPAGKATPLMVSGLKSLGVTPGTSLKSNVSMWLGAPASRMKMHFRALFCMETSVAVRLTVCAGSFEPERK